MKFLLTLSIGVFAGLSLSLPVTTRDSSSDLLVAREPGFGDFFGGKGGPNGPGGAGAQGAKANSDNKNAAGAAAAKPTGGKANMPSASAVQTAATNFANDADTVSASLNALPGTTDPKTVKSLASKAFASESNEDAQRSVLAAAAGDDGAASNAKIVKNTPIVLNGLQNIIDNPASANVKSNVQTIQNARNPNILPSITQLSNAALTNVGLDANQQFFPPTGQNN